jgi:hypothetical protein
MLASQFSGSNGKRRVKACSVTTKWWMPYQSSMRFLDWQPLQSSCCRLQKLAGIVNKYREANKLVEEKGLIFEGHIQKLQLEIEEFQDISPDLPEDLYAHFGKLFIMLRGKLASFEAELDGFLEADKLLGSQSCPGNYRQDDRGGRIWRRKVEDLFVQFVRFPKPFNDPRIPNPKTALGRVKLVNQAIFSATESTPADLDLEQTPLPGTIQLLPNSSFSVTVAGERMIVETKSVNPETPRAQLKVMTKDVIDLARVLSTEDIVTRGVLKCRGYRYNERNKAAKCIKVPCSCFGFQTTSETHGVCGISFSTRI